MASTRVGVIGVGHLGYHHARNYAGIDGIEHGTGLDDDTIAAMAERQVSLVPTMVNLENFPTFAAAGEAKFPRYAAHIRALHARRFATLGKAVDAGVPVYAGTDAGGRLALSLTLAGLALVATGTIHRVTLTFVLPP